MRTVQSILLAVLTVLSAAAGAQPAAEPRGEWVPSLSWDSGVYSYDAAGNVTAIGQDQYRYDGAGRLVSGTARGTAGSADPQTFTYDRYGNLTKIVTDSFTTALAVDPLTNQLDGVCAPGFDGCLKGEFDADTGALTSRNELGHTFDWDPLGMLREIDVASRAERYLYDADDERIATVQSVAGRESRRYTLRGADQKVLRELVHDTATGTWVWSKDYAYRDGTLLAAWLPDGNGAHPDLHYHVDHLGTPRVTTDTRRNKVAEHTYRPFGADAPGSTLHGERLRFTGHERDSSSTHNPLAADPATDFDYMHARYYAPGMGRFLSVDPTWASADLGRPQTWNRYTYVSNNPVNRVDPDGRKDTWAQRAAKKTEELGQTLKDAGASLNNGSVAGTIADATLGTLGDMVGGAGDMLNVGTATGEALGSGADAHDMAMAISQDVGRGSALVLTMAAPAASAHRNLTTTRVFRAVDSVEAADIQATGAFRASPNGTEFKGFFFKRPDAQSFGTRMAQQTGDTYTVVGGRVPNSVVRNSPPHSAATEGPGVLIRNSDLDKVALK